jgi:phospholipase C
VTHSARATCALLVATLIAGCSSPGPGHTESAQAVLPMTPSVTRSAVVNPGSYIKHVIIVVQENRSLPNLFAGFPGADAPTYGYTHTGAIVPLRPVGFTGIDIGHAYADAIREWGQGRMDGFDLDTFESGPSTGQPAGLFPYSYVPRNVVAPYWAMARQYVLADHMFPTEFGASFTAHIDLISGTSNLSPQLAEVDTPDAEPWSCDAPSGTKTDVLTSTRTWEADTGPFPCFTQFQTMADTLDQAAVSWRYYAPVSDAGGDLWSIFGAISKVRYGPDWSNVVTPETTVLTDIPAGRLAAVSWVIPDSNNSDHPGVASSTGPSWVSAVVNAVGNSQYWNSTAIVILWDDWGGWYDDVPPPQKDFVGLGERVPCIIVSPYARPHYVSHTQYEFGSILKFVEQVFALPSLGYTDARATSLVDSFDFTQAPRKFVPIAAPYPPSQFLREKPSRRPPDND